MTQPSAVLTCTCSIIVCLLLGAHRHIIIHIIASCIIIDERVLSVEYCSCTSTVYSAVHCKYSTVRLYHSTCKFTPRVLGTLGVVLYSAVECLLLCALFVLVLLIRVLVFTSTSNSTKAQGSE